MVLVVNRDLKQVFAGKQFEIDNPSSPNTSRVQPISAIPLARVASTGV